MFQCYGSRDLTREVCSRTNYLLSGFVNEWSYFGGGY